MHDLDRLIKKAGAADYIGGAIGRLLGKGAVTLDDTKDKAKKTLDETTSKVKKKTKSMMDSAGQSLGNAAGTASNAAGDLYDRGKNALNELGDKALDTAIEADDAFFGAPSRFIASLGQGYHEASTIDPVMQKASPEMIAKARAERDARLDEDFGVFPTAEEIERDRMDYQAEQLNKRVNELDNAHRAGGQLAGSAKEEIANLLKQLSGAEDYAMGMGQRSVSAREEEEEQNRRRAAKKEEEQNKRRAVIRKGQDAYASSGEEAASMGSTLQDMIGNISADDDAKKGLAAAGGLGSVLAILKLMRGLKGKGRGKVNLPI